jgi:hypothetical protein
MSKLVKLIKELEGKVDTEAYLKEKAVDDMAKKYRIPKTNQHIHNIWNGFNYGELKEILIGGYGDTTSIYGAGPTRLISCASYELKMFAVEKDVQLIKLFGLTSTNNLDYIVDDIRRHINFGNRQYSNFKTENNHIILASGSIDKADVDFSGILTNVQKHGQTYTGDISLYLTKYLGHGNKFPVMINTEEALMKKDSSGLNSLGMDFQSYISRSKEQLNNFASTFKDLKPDYKIWILNVNNI